ncbi:endonuclease/exonuclease/phosphatase family protein [Streptomyces sp.]|uniref:endonuclease/exonuclease/phosphatase family protein n=1 Tax=Streptomyces sp. TaxID=1931 RepID=UPI0028120A2C|nr:endonuclease/exonuclease/phosphatase family protein [Streptomyces sp.]
MRGNVRTWLTAGAAALAVILGLSVAAPGGQGRATPDRRTLRVLHYNLCGAAAVCPWNAGSSGPGTSVARLVREAVRHDPDVVTLNEICLTQYAALKEQLARAGRPMDGTYASSQNNVPACGSSGRFGTAVLSREDVPDGKQWYHPFRHTGGETYTNGGRTVTVRRGLLCADTRFAGGRLIACTAHTYARAPEQLREIRDWTADPAAFPVDVPVVVAGDFNLPPAAPALSHLTGGFAEADEADREPTAGTRKIDYVFADRRHFAVEDGDAEKYAESDHALLKGRFTLRTP